MDKLCCLSRMKKNLRYLAVAAVGAVVAFGFSSCAYDPYYSSVGGSYSTGGYGDGYGYGGSTFSTSIFVGTGDPHWGYDPYCYSYYDYRSRRYYDPYLNGYYPIGYRPPVVYGVPHPHGWHPGRGYIRPPGRIYSGTVANYRNREAAYRNTNYGWAKQVRQGPVGAGRAQGQRPAQSSYDRNNPPSSSRPSTGSRPAYGSQQGQTRSQSGQTMRESSRPDARQQSNSRPPSRYNSSVASQQQQARQGQRAAQANRENRQQAQQKAQQGARNNKAKVVRGYR
jgi:hypothetical protein